MVSYWNAFLFLPSLSLSLPKGELLTFSSYIFSSFREVSLSSREDFRGIYTQNNASVKVVV